MPKSGKVRATRMTVFRRKVIHYSLVFHFLFDEQQWMVNRTHEVEHTSFVGTLSGEGDKKWGTYQVGKHRVEGLVVQILSRKFMNFSTFFFIDDYRRVSFHHQTSNDKYAPIIQFKHFSEFYSESNTAPKDIYLKKKGFRK